MDRTDARRIPVFDIRCFGYLTTRKRFRANGVILHHIPSFITQYPFTTPFLLSLCRIIFLPLIRVCALICCMIRNDVMTHSCVSILSYLLSYSYCLCLTHARLCVPFALVDGFSHASRVYRCYST